MFFKKEPTYIIYSWPYSDEVGGFIALHSLCDSLRKSGYDAYIWPAGLPVTATNPSANWIPSCIKRRKPPNIAFRTNPRFDTPLACPTDLQDAIVIYPEVIEGNPLNANRVVRWLLNKPGRLTGKVNYTGDEIFFFFQEAFNDPSLNPNPSNKLQLFTLLDDIYQQTEPAEGRNGTCYIIRKGKDRAPTIATLDGPVIDNLTHKEIAAIFNKHEYCVSYDMYTMYSVYAAMCGCKSIIQPDPKISKQEWQPSIELTYGLAYGHSDLEWSERTRGEMLEHYRQVESDNIKSVKEFTKKCAMHFELKIRK